MPKRIKVKVNVYTLLEEAIERGIRYGYYRAHKHTGKPTEDMLIEEILRGAMNELCELIDLNKSG